MTIHVRAMSFFFFFSFLSMNVYASDPEDITDEWLRNFETEMRLNIKSVRQRSYKQPALWGEEIDRNLALLRSDNIQDQVRAVFNAAVLFSSNDHGVSDSFRTYQAQLNAFIQGENLLLRQSASLAKAMLLKRAEFSSDLPARLVETRRLLQECSEHPVFDWIRYMSYDVEADDLTDNNQPKETYQLWKKAFDVLPECYHLWIKLNLAAIHGFYWDAESSYRTERVENLLSVVAQGSFEQQAWAYELLVDIYSYAGAYFQSQERNAFYNPTEVFRITRMVLDTPDLLRFRSVESVQLSIARLKHRGSDDVKDEAGALEIYEGILGKKGEIDKGLYECASHDAIDLISRGSEKSVEKAKRAVELAEEILRDPLLHESVQYSVLSALGHLYGSNITGFRDIGKAREYKRKILEIGDAGPESQKNMLGELYRLMLDEESPDFENGAIVCRQLLTHPAFKPHIFYDLRFENDGVKRHPSSVKIVVNVLLENEPLSGLALEQLALLLRYEKVDMETAMRAKMVLLRMLDQATTADETRRMVLTALSDLYRNQPEIRASEEAISVYLSLQSLTAVPKAAT